MSSSARILSRALDPLFTGLASIAVVALLLALGAPVAPHLGERWTLTLQSLINWPHFMAAYVVLYASPASVRRYRAAAVWFPAALFAYAVFAIAVCERHPIHADLLQWASALYLARHYTGQTWGMMASFAHVEKVRFSDGERRLVRAGLDLMMLWHMSWAAATISGVMAPSIAAPCAALYHRMTPVALASFALGAVGLIRLGVRLRRVPPLRVWVPWVALYSWYLLLAVDATAAVVVQMAHALQYLIFPMRIELNRAPGERESRVLLTRFALWTALGLVVLAGVSGLFGVFYRAAGGHGDVDGMVTAVIGACVAVHHYFVDGTLYKLRNPQVRRDLFAHLTAPRDAERPLAPVESATG